MSRTSPKYRSNPNNEEWRPIKDYEGLYEVSSLGRVRSAQTNKLKKTRVGKTGYVYVLLWKDNKDRLCTVHRLVAYAFIPQIEGKPFIDHINTNRDDNRVENLRWCTHQENCNNPLSKEKSSLSHKGHINSRESIEKWKSSRRAYQQTPEYDSFIERLKSSISTPVIQLSEHDKPIREFPSVKAAADSLKISPSGIFAVLKGEQKTSGGYKWSRKHQNTE